MGVLKPVPDMTYNVFGGTLNLAQSSILDLITASQSTHLIPTSLIGIMVSS